MVQESRRWRHSRSADTHGGCLGDKKLIKRAVDLGYAPAMTALAKMQPDDAKQLYEAAANLGEPEALFRVGKVKESAARGYPEALAASGNVRRLPRPVTSLRWSSLGCAAKPLIPAIPKALYLYGMSLPDKVDGANWLRRAAEKGHAAR